MAEKTRSKYSVMNVFAGVFGQIITMVLGFATRTVFIYTLGKAYLGISGLFQNVLQILSITDLGLEAAIVFSLYKPLADKDTGKIAAIVSLYKKVYRVIGVLIFIFGLCLIPVLPYLIKGKSDVINIYTVYILFLFQTAVSYLCFAYCKTVYTADQRGYKTSIISVILRTISAVCQIIVLLIFRNYYAYLIIEVLMVVASNIAVGICSKKDYPYIWEKTKAKVPKEELTEIKKNVFGSALYKICGVVTNSTDNLLISAMVGVDVVGIYSNYLLFTNYIQIFLNLVFNGVTASIGNLFVTDTKEHNEFIFRCLNLLNLWLYGFCGIALFCLINPFISLIWLHDESYLLPFSTVFIIFFYMVLVGLQYSVKSYRNACGLFWKGKFRPVATVVVNLVVSIVLCNYIGLNGILLGTVVSHITTLFWYDPFLLYKHIFGKSVKGYFLRYTVNLASVVGLGLLLYYVFGLLPNTVLFFFLKAVIVTIVPNGLFILVYSRTNEFKYLMKTFLSPVLKKLPVINKTALSKMIIDKYK